MRVSSEQMQDTDKGPISKKKTNEENKRKEAAMKWGIKGGRKEIKKGRGKQREMKKNID